jgi:hypothetical protein
MENKEQLETLTEIRTLMERSTRFLSLNGLAGVFAGIFALAGAFAAYMYLDFNINRESYYHYATIYEGGQKISSYIFFFTDAFSVLFASVGVAFYLALRKAKKKGLKVWDNTAKRALINMMIPLVSGGILCLILVYHGYIGLVAPMTLLFYGLSLVHTSKYTFEDVRYLGIGEIILGLLSIIWLGYGLLFWAAGFGIFHIIYGIIMYYKYER